MRDLQVDRYRRATDVVAEVGQQPAAPVVDHHHDDDLTAGVEKGGEGLEGRAARVYALGVHLAELRGPGARSHGQDLNTLVRRSAGGQRGGVELRSGVEEQVDLLKLFRFPARLAGIAPGRERVETGR